MKKPHAGFWLATLGLGVCWLLALLTRDRLNGILLAGAALALIFTPAARRKGAAPLPWVASAWMGFGATAACCTTAGNTACRSGPSRCGSASAAGGIGCWTWSERPHGRWRCWAPPSAFAYAVSRKLDALLPGVPPEFMLLLLAVGWSIYLPAVSWLQWKQRDS